jgi:hypothetical protein
VTQGFDHSDVDAEEYVDECIADDSTECDCSMCRGAEDRFWREQGEHAGELAERDDVEAESEEERP